MQGKKTVQNSFTELTYITGQKKTIMPIEGQLCNESQVPSQPPFQDDVCWPRHAAATWKEKERGISSDGAYGHWCCQIALGQLSLSQYPSVVSAGVYAETDI